MDFENEEKIQEAELSDRFYPEPENFRNSAKPPFEPSIY